MTDTTSINFFDPATNDCPYHAYQTLRDEAPVWQDPHTGMFVVTRYEDIKCDPANPDLFTNARGQRRRDDGEGGQADRPRGGGQGASRRAQWRSGSWPSYTEDEGWPPVATLDALDPPLHMELRRMFDHAFRPGRVKQLDPYVESLTNTLFDAFIDDGECEWVKAVAIPLPLYVIGARWACPRRTCRGSRRGPTRGCSASG